MLRPERTYLLPVAIIAAFLAVAVFAIITYVNTVSIRRSEEKATQAYAVREATYQILSAMKDAEIGQRGCLLTNDSRFLDIYESGIDRGAEQVRQLIKLTSDNPEVLHQAVVLHDAFERQKMYLERTILTQPPLHHHLSREATTDQDRGTAPDHRVELVDVAGQTTMKQARNAVEKILKVEKKRLADSEESRRERTAVSRTTITAGNLLAIGLISFAGFAAIVDRKKRDRAERDLIHQQNELQAVIESAFEGILTFDDDLQIRYMNPAAAEILRVDPGHMAIRNHSLLEFFPDDQQQMTHQNVKDFNASGRMGQPLGQRMMRRSSGEAFSCEGTAIRTISNDDHFTTVKFRDVSETQILKARQQEYALILGQVQEAIVVCGLGDQIESWNGGAEKLFQISADDAIGQNIVLLLFPSRAEQWRADTEVLLDKGSHAAEISRIDSLGQEKVIEKRRSLIFDDHGQPTAQLVFMIDATDRVREEAKERRSQRLESIGTLAGGVAHDLNNVLTPIVMSAKLLRRGSKSPERLVDNIITSADRGARMIQKLLAFAGGEQTDRQSVDVRNLLAELEEILTHTLPPTIDMQVHVPSKLQRIDTDNTEISQVIMNLAINARDAMPTGGQLVIEVEDYDVDEQRAAHSDGLRAGPHILLTISDTGEGIPKEIIDRIFDPFFTTKEQGKGTGLGLATTMGIVRSCRGDISVDSEPGIGTKFSILVPASQSKALVATADDTPMQVIPLGQGETILLVDDEEMILEMAQQTLESSNYRVLITKHGAEAIKIFKQRSSEIGVVVLDMMMPGMDGFQTKEILRGCNANAKIIASSGLRRPRNEGCRMQDIDGFLPKPYTDEHLLRLVREVLDKKP